MSRPTAVPLPRGVHGGPRAAAPPVRLLLPWALVGAAVLVQIVYPLVPDAVRAEITVASVLVFCAALGERRRAVHGPRGAAVLLAVAGGGGLLVEAVGVHTGVPFGAYAYTGDLGAEVLGVPAVVPLAWTMMAWPALVVGRTLARRLAGRAGRLRRGRRAGGLGPVPRPADGRRRALDVGAPAPRRCRSCRACRSRTTRAGWSSPWSWSGCCDRRAAPPRPGRRARPRRSTCGPTGRRCWPTSCSSTGRARRWSAASRWGCSRCPSPGCCVRGAAAGQVPGAARSVRAR